jgi:hypothetical protein
MSRGPDSSTMLERALLRESERLGCAASIAASEMTRWASATFTGARHQLTLTAPCSDAFDWWIAGLPEAEFRLRGHLVADLAVTRLHRHDGLATATLEVLTVEDR